MALPQGPEHQPVCPALRGQHVEGGSAEQEEAVRGPLLPLLHAAELGKRDILLGKD